MTYEEASRFTPEQKRVAARIKRALRDAYKLGLYAVAKQNNLYLFRAEIYKHSTVEWRESSRFATPLLEAGFITDAGADDEEHLEKGFIDE